MATATKVKTVLIIARIQFKVDARKVVYLVRASNGIDQYETYVFDGRAVSCTCDSRKPCYHMTQLEQKESERAGDAALAWVKSEVEKDMEAAPEAYVREEIDEDVKAEQWLEGCIEDEETIDDLIEDETESHAAIDAEYEAWKRENDLDMPLTEEQINDIARYELAVL
jgi:hypothetical protein